MRKMGGNNSVLSMIINKKKKRERIHAINSKSRIFLESKCIEFFLAIHEQSAPG